MDSVNKTLYIPLYGKSFVSKKGVILDDKMAEKIWDSEGFALKGRSSSKWLAYYMGMRARVFDDWTGSMIDNNPEAIVLHLGCGLDSRVKRVGKNCPWYDIDFPDVIAERRKYFSDNESYTMLATDLSKSNSLDAISGHRTAIVVMEGISMYLSSVELSELFQSLNSKFEKVHLLMDCYTVFGAKMSKVKNPINDVGVTEVHGMDDPKSVEITGLSFIKEHEMTPENLVNELSGMEKTIFRKVYGGKMSKKLYKLYEYKK